MIGYGANAKKEWSQARRSAPVVCEACKTFAQRSLPLTHPQVQATVGRDRHVNIERPGSPDMLLHRFAGLLRTCDGLSAKPACSLTVRAAHFYKASLDRCTGAPISVDGDHLLGIGPTGRRLPRRSRCSRARLSYAKRGMGACESLERLPDGPSWSYPAPYPVSLAGLEFHGCPLCTGAREAPSSFANFSHISRRLPVCLHRDPTKWIEWTASAMTPLLTAYSGRRGHCLTQLGVSPTAACCTDCLHR